MNLFSPILRLFGVGGLSNTDTGAQYASSADVSTDAGISVTDERALKVSAVWSCVQLISNSVASLPLKFYEQGQDGRQEVTTHFLVDLFHKSPNALMKPRDFRLAMTMQMALWNNAYAKVDWSGNRPVSITPLKPGRVQPVITDKGDLTYHYSTEKGVAVYSRRSIMHLKGFGTDGVVGLERVSYARHSLGLAVSADTYAASQFANGGNGAGGYLMLDNFLTKDQRQQMRELYAGMSETAYNKNRLWILEGGLKYEPNTLPPDTMQMIETRQMQSSEICRYFGVPDVLIGASANSSAAWPASFEQQMLSFLTFTIQPYLDEWECAIQETLVDVTARRKVFADHDTTGFVRLDSDAKAKLQAAWVQNGLKTRNEIRRMNNDTEIPGGDDLTVQVNLTPIQKLGENNVTQAEQPATDVQPEIRQ